MSDNYDYPEPDYPPENSETVAVDVTVSWNNSDIQQQVVEAITKQIYNDIKDDVRKAVFGKLDDTVNVVMLEAMDKQVQRTNRWGEPLDGSASIKDLLLRETEEWLSAMVDRYGRHTDSYSRSQTRAQYLFKEATKDDLPARVKKIVAQNIGDIDALIESAVKMQLRAKLK